VFDTVGGDALADAYSTLKRGGMLVTIAGRPDEATVNQAKANQLGIQIDRFSSQSSGELLAQFAQLIEGGQVKTFVGNTFPLAEAAQAQELCQKGHGRARIVLQVA
jgi:NADPH:quinone reductase-like Zn-dependent oxidoreductase